MTYNCSATKMIVDLIGLSPRSQAFVEFWFSKWNGSELPDSRHFSGLLPKSFEPLTMTYAVNSNSVARIDHVGSELARIGASNLVGKDWPSAQH